MVPAHDSGVLVEHGTISASVVVVVAPVASAVVVVVAAGALVVSAVSSLPQAAATMARTTINIKSVRRLINVLLLL
jgi:hypothetical protein